MDPVEAGGASNGGDALRTEAPVPMPETAVPAEWIALGTLAIVAALLLGFLALRHRGAPPRIAEPAPEARPAELAPAEEPGLLGRFRHALGRSRAALQERFDQLFRRDHVDEALFEDLELALLSADVGMPTTQKLLGALRDLVRAGERDPAVLRRELKLRIAGLFEGLDSSMLEAPAGEPRVILIVGVNGSGKTTTIGKLASLLRRSGKKVLVAASDTYRAAAIDQLAVWATRAGADLVAHQPGADPGAVAYDALQAARARGVDVVLVDTAGRLQTARPLMEQLGKIRRVLAKVVPSAPHETLLVLDGTMGQNALSQAQLFHEATPLTGVVVTKLDGTAKGGMILTIASELRLPVKLVGIGEKEEDLRPFDAEAFVEALA